MQQIIIHTQVSRYVLAVWVNLMHLLPQIVTAQSFRLWLTLIKIFLLQFLTNYDLNYISRIFCHLFSLTGSSMQLRLHETSLFYVKLYY